MSVIISGLLHGGIIAWAITGLASTKEFKVEPVKSVPVDILTTSEFTKIKAGKKDAKKKTAAVKPEKKPEKKQDTKKKKKKTKAVLPPPKSEPEKAEALPKPKPKKAEKKPAKPKPKPKPKKKVVKKTPVKKKSLPTSKTTKRNKNFDADRIAALLNKIPDGGRISEPQAKPISKPVKQAKGRPSGQDETMSISEIDAFRRQIESCWNPPIGGLGAESLVVKIQFEFNRDGTLANPPRVLNSRNSTVFKAVADSAVRAIWQCQPFNLPEKKYDIWKDMTLKFDPREIYGG